MADWASRKVLSPLMLFASQVVLMNQHSQSVSQSVFVNEDIYRINKLTTTDKALYRFYVADKPVPPIYLRELS